MAARGQLKWGNIDKLKEAIDSYFDRCDQLDEAPNIADLCVALKIGKETFAYYANGRYEHRLALEAREKKQELIEAQGEDAIKEITAENNIYEGNLPVYYTDDSVDSIKAQVSEALKTAKTRLEGWNWKKGYLLKNPAMAIFALKAVHGYTDQPQELNLHQNNIQLNIKLDTTGAQKLQNQPTITVTAEPADD